MTSDLKYLVKNVSENAATNFDSDNINELIAEVGVLRDRTDLVLLNKVEGVLNYGHGRETE
ncbi:hypothetical protein [Dolosigranulum pigrum]|nr:hypothetical protein [Dolosigranulum pigrum]QTJ34495.1 hypothetical protein FE322_03770 [Dolosigranulum pigrum]QTJ39675.1 hypothetical protein FE325_03745 [Dolosigranulum pigrum]QTJ48165.1 hypothetical protein FE330_03765 [Dolosigranulum pigrum]RAN56438.1 hypothetical protein B8A33_05215 [Dolosigranulum pigrum]